MDTFRWISVVISTVLALGVARILNGYVAAFKARNSKRFDWLPLLLAGVVLLEIFQFWWALEEISAVRSWSLGGFAMLLLLIVLLFLAAALVIPAEGDSHDPVKEFQRDGHYAFGLMAAYYVTGFAANILLWQSKLLSPENLMLVVLAGVAAAAVALRQRRWHVVLGIALAVLVVIDTLIASPLRYG